MPSPFFAPAAAQQPGPACATAAHRAFDFWIGDWRVTAAGQDTPTATNRITSEHGGCVLRENYATKGGYTGMSMSFYDAARKTWHHTWIGTDGSALFVEGGPDQDGRMVLSSRNAPSYRDGDPVNRIIWTPQDGGSVRQHWQASADGGESWSTVFDGLYVRVPSAPAR